MKTKQETKHTNMLKGAFMIFIFPIITVFLGVFLGGYLGKILGVSIKISQITGGIIAFIIAAIIIKFFDKSVVLDENAEKIYWEDL